MVSTSTLRPLSGPVPNAGMNHSCDESTDLSAAVKHGRKNCVAMYEYRAGQTVPHSGIYSVLHDRSHAQPHEVTCVYGEPFPPYHCCGHSVRYRLVRAAIHVTKGR